MPRKKNKQPAFSTVVATQDKLTPAHYLSQLEELVSLQLQIESIRTAIWFQRADALIYFVTPLINCSVTLGLTMLEWEVFEAEATTKSLAKNALKFVTTSIAFVGCYLRANITDIATIPALIDSYMFNLDYYDETKIAATKKVLVDHLRILQQQKTKDWSAMTDMRAALFLYLIYNALIDSLFAGSVVNINASHVVSLVVRMIALPFLKEKTCPAITDETVQKQLIHQRQVTLDRVLPLLRIFPDGIKPIFEDTLLFKDILIDFGNKKGFIRYGNVNLSARKVSKEFLYILEQMKIIAYPLPGKQCTIKIISSSAVTKDARTHDYSLVLEQRLAHETTIQFYQQSKTENFNILLQHLQSKTAREWSWSKINTVDGELAICFSTVINPSVYTFEFMHFLGDSARVERNGNVLNIVSLDVNKVFEFVRNETVKMEHTQDKRAEHVYTIEQSAHTVPIVTTENPVKVVVKKEKVKTRGTPYLAVSEQQNDNDMGDNSGSSSQACSDKLAVKLTKCPNVFFHFSGLNRLRTEIKDNIKTQQIVDVLEKGIWLSQSSRCQEGFKVYRTSGDSNYLIVKPKRTLASRYRPIFTELGAAEKKGNETHYTFGFSTLRSK